MQYIDRFGNAATTIPASAVRFGPWTLTLGEFTLPGATTYGSVAIGKGLAPTSSYNFVEIAVNQGSAQQRYGLGVGDHVLVSGSS